MLAINPPTAIEAVAACLFLVAILHTFLTKQVHHLASRFAHSSWQYRLLHLFGEVELVFAIWSIALLALMAALDGPIAAWSHVKNCNYTEAVFVCVIVVLCGTKPVLDFAERVIVYAARALPVSRPLAFYATALTVGPLLGSFITEPAAMTVTALLLYKFYFTKDLSTSCKYATLGTLFVNVSIGGTLTPYAAPPILMVAGPWGWDLMKMLSLFGWKGAIASILTTALVTWRFRKELGEVVLDVDTSSLTSSAWRQALYLGLLGATVFSAHYPLLLVAILISLYGLSFLFKEKLLLRNGVLVGLFLAGLVTLGNPQAWWLRPILGGLDNLSLYLGAMGLTAFTDNAALTYLGSLIPDLSEAARYSLVAGAVVGGGLTVIANAPNPAGYAILNPAFGEDGASPLGLFLAALTPTAIAAILFWFL